MHGGFRFTWGRAIIGVTASRAGWEAFVARAQVEGSRVRGSVPLIRPYGLAGTRWDAFIGWACCAALLAVLLLELVTPNDVMASLTLIPLVGGMWALSTRVAIRVALVAAVVFAVVLATEAANRPTVVFIGVVALILASVVRFYAGGLTTLWPVSRPASIVLDAGSGVDSLTRRELEVATLASRGYTAAEIGSRLHISDRTVESHLANAYAKLAIHSRSGLRDLSQLLN